MWSAILYTFSFTCPSLRHATDDSIYYFDAVCICVKYGAQSCISNPLLDVLTFANINWFKIKTLKASVYIKGKNIIIVRIKCNIDNYMYYHIWSNSYNFLIDICCACIAYYYYYYIGQMHGIAIHSLHKEDQQRNIVKLWIREGNILQQLKSYRDIFNSLINDIRYFLFFQTVRYIQIISSLFFQVFDILNLLT